jgi:hypothetical protein
MLEIEQAQINTEAQDRLGKIREQLGLPAAGDQASLESGSGAAESASRGSESGAAGSAENTETPARANPPGDATT